jgi:hypothetical protein
MLLTKGGRIGMSCLVLWPAWAGPPGPSRAGSAQCNSAALGGRSFQSFRTFLASMASATRPAEVPTAPQQPPGSGREIDHEPRERLRA